MTNKLAAPHCSPSLLDAINKLVERYGPDAVKAATMMATKKRRGPKTLKDWSKIRPELEKDARIWLNGGPLIGKLSNTQIAKQAADCFPGHNRASTQRRIMGKLSNGRSKATLIAAWYIAEREQPYGECIKVLRSLIARDPLLKDFAEDRAKRLCRTVNEYRHRFDSFDPVIPPTVMRKRLAALPPLGIGAGLLFSKFPQISVNLDAEEG